MTRPEEPSKYVWKWTTWSTICLGIGVLVALLGITAGANLFVSVVLGVAVGLGGAIVFGIVPRNPPKPGIHGSGSMPGRRRTNGTPGTAPKRTPGSRPNTTED